MAGSRRPSPLLPSGRPFFQLSAFIFSSLALPPCSFFLPARLIPRSCSAAGGRWPEAGGRDHCCRQVASSFSFHLSAFIFHLFLPGSSSLFLLPSCARHPTVRFSGWRPVAGSWRPSPLLPSGRPFFQLSAFNFQLSAFPPSLHPAFAQGYGGDTTTFPPLSHRVASNRCTW